jgi:hypothetical protein
MIGDIGSLVNSVSVNSMSGLKNRPYETIDIYTNGLSHMYNWGHPGDKPPNFGQISKLPSSPINPSVVPYGNLTGLGGDVHDTFKIDRYDNPYWAYFNKNIWE